MTRFKAPSLTLGKRIAAVGCLVLVTISAALFYFIQQGFFEGHRVHPA